MQKRKVTKRERKMKKGMNFGTWIIADDTSHPTLVNPMNFKRHNAGV